VVIEITEHARVDDYDALRRALAEWRRAGVKLAVDDAGAGFASLRHIRCLEPDIIKLDVELVRDIDTDRRALAKSLITFGHETDALSSPRASRATRSSRCCRTWGSLLVRATTSPALLLCRYRLPDRRLEGRVATTTRRAGRRAMRNGQRSHRLHLPGIGVVIGRSKVDVPAPQRDALTEAEPDNPKG
jgi:hypothetical protein